MNKVRRSVLMIFLGLCIVVSSGCGMFASKDSTEKSKDNDQNGTQIIKIGVIAAETGPASTLGKSQVNTVKLLQKQLDEAGGIDGKKIELVFQDYETDDTKAVIAVDRLISQGVVGIVGATQVSTTMAVTPKATNAKIPLFATAFTSKEDDFIFNMATSNEVQGLLILDILKKKNITKVGWINAKDAFGVDGLPYFEKHAKENNIEIVAHEEFDANASDMTIQLTNIKKKNPEAVVVWSRTPGAGVVARNFKALDFNIPMIHSSASANQGFLDQVKDNNDDIYVLGSKLNIVDQLPDSEEKQRLVNFRDGYREEFGSDPDFFAAHAYDGISIILEAIKADNQKANDVKNFVRKELGTFHGITGTFDFKSGQNGANEDGLSVLSIEDNKWKYNE